MNWRLILYLSLFGPLIGGLKVFGLLPRGMELFAWLVVTVFCSIVIGRQPGLKHFANGAVVGFISGATETLIQGLFAATLVSNNPWIVSEFADMPEGFDTQFFIMMLVPFIGVTSAFAGGFLAHLAARVMKRSREGTGT
ncbi:MAG: hypothetical protein IH969_01540 [Candidatus Krumholzibacteriota bacterium]|nr:hypothetical protein [Candidatus Krumholzibacteriota bacterium]